jgi:hypothetical protein
MRNLSSIAQQESLINRIGRKDSLEEVTVGFSASSSTPSSLGEIWMKNAHFPVLVDNMFRRHSAPQKENLELAKFMITVHSLYPYAEREVEDNLLQLVQGELIKLRKEHDPNGYDDLVNLDVRTGSPRMILGIAKSLARVSGIQAVSTGEIQSALEQFVETRHELADSWIERGYDHNMEHMSTELKLRSIGRSATQIYRFLVEHPGSLRAEIRERFPKIQESVLNTILDEMVRLGVAS